MLLWCQSLAGPQGSKRGQQAQRLFWLLQLPLDRIVEVIGKGVSYDEVSDAYVLPYDNGSDQPKRR
jgi:hypothetical protein